MASGKNNGKGKNNSNNKGKEITAEDLFGGGEELKEEETKDESNVVNIVSSEEVEEKEEGLGEALTELNEQIIDSAKEAGESPVEAVKAVGEIMDIIQDMPDIVETKEIPKAMVQQTFEEIINIPAPRETVSIGDNDNTEVNMFEEDDSFTISEEEQQINAEKGNDKKYNEIIGGLSKMAEVQTQVGVNMEKAGVIRTFRFAEAIKMVLGNNYADDVIFRGDITPQKLVEMSKGNTDVAAKISEEMYLKGCMPVAWLISLKPENYVTAGVNQAHILQGGNFNRQTIDVNKIVSNYGEYMVRGSDGSITPYIDAEPFSNMMGTSSITAILSSKRIFSKLAKMVADVEGISNQKYRLGITLNPQSPKDSLVVLTVLSPMGNTLLK